MMMRNSTHTVSLYYAALLTFGLLAVAALSIQAQTTPPDRLRENILRADTSVEPGTTYYVSFPELGQTWRDTATRAGIYYPSEIYPEVREWLRQNVEK